MRSTSGITCCHFFCSAVFSMPVCRYPIVGDADKIVSPSSVSTSRSTPCVLGCCGPMLTVIVSVRISGTLAPRHLVALDVLAEFFGRHLQRLRDVRRTADLDGRVLAERPAFPVLGHQQAAWIRMAVEPD